jgi:hypothetical protein
MIRANTRGRLTAADLQLVILLLSRGSAHRRAYLERRLMTEGPDALLDAPELVERLLTVRSMLLPSEALFFYVLVRHALRTTGLDDRDLADYLAALLLEFGQRDRAWRIDWNDDQRHRYLVDILADLEATAGDRRFKVMVHLGNYARDSFPIISQPAACAKRAQTSATTMRLAAEASAWPPIMHSPPNTDSRWC